MENYNIKNIFRIHANFFAASLIVTSCSCQVQENKLNDKNKPNIIFILSDDLGYGDLGCYGQKEIMTPNIDQMAREGIRLTSHYAGSTVCAPSRCALMTGLHTGHCFIRDNARIPLTPEHTTMAELLKEVGYNTALIGKWGLGNPGSTGVPTKQGFDYFFGYMDQGHAHNYYTSFLWRNEEKVELSNIVPEESEVGSGVASEKNEYTHDLFTEEALIFIENQKEKPGPFFLYLAYTIPHANNEAGRKDGDGMEVPDHSDYNEKDWPVTQKKHAAMISRMDRDIGRIFSKLKDLGMDENTIVFFTSDNGPHAEGGVNPEFNNSNGIYRGYKRDLYEGGIRVPMIVKWPDKIKAGEVSDHISAFWDIMPTISNIACVKNAPVSDGISFLPVLTGKGKQKIHKYLYWEFASQNGKQAVRMQDWKGIRLNLQNNPDSPVELYNLKNDPAEKINVADSNPGIVKKIRKIMEEAHSESSEFPLINTEGDNSK